ncbi:hypothetical protein HERIO_209 [Hepatospora eriocheir]|uniref:Uncharacterized protein n=1 Tax=Hepatospora eriocheir TaxID=1081669 RepID=A0A1X0QE11_9MICR|nr:hypothetical protein HERIO_209 [Hepatospora eriocheir]
MEMLSGIADIENVTLKIQMVNYSSNKMLVMICDKFLELNEMKNNWNEYFHLKEINVAYIQLPFKTEYSPTKEALLKNLLKVIEVIEPIAKIESFCGIYTGSLFAIELARIKNVSVIPLIRMKCLNELIDTHFIFKFPFLKNKKDLIIDEHFNFFKEEIKIPKEEFYSFDISKDYDDPEVQINTLFKLINYIVNPNSIPKSNIQFYKNQIEQLNTCFSMFKFNSSLNSDDQKTLSLNRKKFDEMYFSNLEEENDDSSMNLLDVNETWFCLNQ